MDLAGLGFLQHNDQNGLAVRRAAMPKALVETAAA